MRFYLKNHAFIQTLECALIPGLPDLYMIAPDFPPVFIEAKIMPNDNNKIPFRLGQLDWLKTNIACGGNSLVMIRIIVDEPGIVLLDAGAIDQNKTLRENIHQATSLEILALQSDKQGLWLDVFEAIKGVVADAAQKRKSRKLA